MSLNSNDQQVKDLNDKVIKLSLENKQMQKDLFALKNENKKINSMLKRFDIMIKRLKNELHIIDNSIESKKR